MSINEYLVQKKNDHSFKEKSTVVIGNEAADLDSMASSVAYAYYLAHSGINAVPVMNIPRNDFALRTEAVFLFREANIDPDDLLFLDDVDLKALHNKELLDLILIDHNILGSNQKILKPAVSEILDHHADEGDYPSSAKVDIRPVGSTATMVAERFIQDHESLIDKEVGTLLFGTILLDTVNLDDEAGRVTPTDRKVADDLERITALDPSALFEKLQFEKFNVSSLGSYDLLRKDYKEWQMGGVKCGIGSVLMSARDWIAKDEKILDAFRSFAEDRGLDVLLAMNAYTDPEFTRNLAVYVQDTELRIKTIGFLETSDLGLEVMDSNFSGEDSELVFYRQANLGISRKKLQPLLVDYFKD